MVFCSPVVVFSPGDLNPTKERGFGQGIINDTQACNRGQLNSLRYNLDVANHAFSRREFLRLAALSAATLAARPLLSASQQQSGLLGRVSYDSVSVFDAPRLDASPLNVYKFRDTLLDLQYSLTPLTGPAYNPKWYRIAEGYVHSAFIQEVAFEPNLPVTAVPETGQLFRVTVPFTQPYVRANGEWKVEERYKLYYHSCHWVTEVLDGPDGKKWYKIVEVWEGVTYYAAATDLRPVPESEFAPISSDVPAASKHIEISLAAQQLTAYEDDRMVMRTSISSGVKNSGATGLPTETPQGTFYIYSKLPTKYMGDNRLTDNLGDRYLPGVPWTCFFEIGGYAIHGAYWHNNFGAPMSKGCINVPPDKAEWLYRWTTPTAGPNDSEKTGHGTRVVVS